MLPTRCYLMIAATAYLTTVCLSSAAAAEVYAGDWPARYAKVRPVPLANVQVQGFLGKRIRQNVASLLKGMESPIPRGFEARVAGVEPGPETQRLAADSDLYKWIEGAAYTFAITGDKAVEKQLERIAGMVVACQRADGYINTQSPPNLRFDPKVNHELYTAGHFFEAAVAHYRATGRRTLLDAASRWADYLIRENASGNPYFAVAGEKEHSEYELGFLRLSRATGERKYLEFAELLARKIPVGPELFSGRYAARSHAVRVNYLLSGYADLYLETGSNEFRNNLQGVWDDIVSNRSYVTGGVSVHERYPAAHELPQVTGNMTRDIAETCTSISLIMFGWRMNAITGESRFYDQMETILYNHFLGGVALDNLGTFYYNPLKMLGEPKGKTDHTGPATHRTMLPQIHSTACCITNEWRFFGALSEYLYSFDDRGLFVNLYSTSKVKQPLGGGKQAEISVETNYPHDGEVRLHIDNTQPAAFALRLRIPAWCTRATVAVGKGSPQPARGGEYMTLDRTWKPGETVVLKMEMPVRMILPDSREKDNLGQAVLARGPLVYCLDQADADFPIGEAAWDLQPASAAAKTEVEWKKELLGGINVIRAPGMVAGSKKRLTLIPYYARANRNEENHWTTFLRLSSMRLSSVYPALTRVVPDDSLRAKSRIWQHALTGENRHEFN